MMRQIKQQRISEALAREKLAQLAAERMKLEKEIQAIEESLEGCNSDPDHVQNRIYT